jgi:outer membrane receptor protein involved in Fe transport
MPSKINPRSVLALCAALSLGAGLTRAQSAPAASPSLLDEDTVVLSPFMVETSQDEGKYRATETLGGARIRTNLRDIASPLSVVTAQFLQDTGSNNNQDLLTYTTSTEVGGLFGNWGGFGNSQGLSDRGTLLSPNQNTRVRGLDQADNTRNFFLTDIPWDSYNIERVEIQRGPNSILFGVGSPAGIINANTVQARFDGNRGKIENQFSKFNSIRWVGDYNLELVDNLLAVRFSGLVNNQRFRQEPAFNNDRRGYVTATFQPQVLPKEWAGRLTVRATYERASIEANRPRMLPPEDAITLWFDDVAGDGVANKWGLGKAVVDMFLYNQSGGGDPSGGPLSRSEVLNPFYQPGTAAIDPGALNNGGVGFWFKNGESRPFFVSRQAARAYPGALAADGSVDNAIGILYGSPLRVGGLNQYAVQVDRIDTTEGRTSRYPLASRGYYKDQTLSDPSIFNFYDYLIDGDNKREFQKWDASSLSIAQTFFDNRLGLEFVYDSQSYSEWREGATWNRPYISIDINKNYQDEITQYTRTADGLVDPSTYRVYGFTPTASRPYANPMAGAAFTAGSFSSNNRTDRERDNYRLTATGELRAADFFDRESLLTRILGRHTLTGLLSREERRDAQTQWVPSAVPYDWAMGLSVSGENTALGDDPRSVVPIIYLSDPLFGASTASGLNLGPIQTYYNPAGTYQVDYFKTQWLPSRNPADPNYVDPGAPWTDLLGGVGVQADNPFNYTGRTNAAVSILNADAGDRSQLITSYGVTEQKVDSTGLVWQGHLLGGSIVPTVGWREDTLATYTARGARDATGIVSTRVGETKKTLESKGRTTSWGVVGHLPSRWIENVPVLAGISAYYNYGENNRVQARYNFDGAPLANPTAESKDYGIVLSAFDDRLNIKLGKYETKVKNANLPGTGSILGANEWYLSNVEAWGTANTLLYAFGHAGLDPNQSWHWNHAMVDDNGWGDPAYDPHTALFRNHPSTVRQLAAMDAWMAGIDAQFFQNYQINADVPALVSAYQSWRTTGNIQPLVNAAQASGFAVGTYTQGFRARGLITGISPNGTIDNTSEGYELEIDYTPVPNWNIKINAAKTNAYRENLGQPMLDFINTQYSKLQGPAGDIRLWWGGDRNVRQYYEDFIISAVDFQKESIGFQVPELRPWRFGAISNYSFTDGRLRGFNFGGAYRWEDRQILGYRLKTDKSGLDVQNALYGEREDHIDLWAGYQRKVTPKITWRIQLNLRNVGEKVGLTPISVNPDGVVAAQRITEGMSWGVTNSFLF